MDIVYSSRDHDAIAHKTLVTVKLCSPTDRHSLSLHWHVSIKEMLLLLCRDALLIPSMHSATFADSNERLV